MSIDKNDPRQKPMGGLMLPPPQMEVARQDGTVVVPKTNPKMQQVPTRIQPPPTPELKTAKAGGDGLRTGVATQTTSKKVATLGYVDEAVRNNAEYIALNTAGSVQDISTFDEFVKKARELGAPNLETLYIATNYAGNVLSNKSGWSVQLEAENKQKEPVLEEKVGKFDIKKPVEAEKKLEEKDLALDLKKIRQRREENEGNLEIEAIEKKRAVQDEKPAQKEEPETVVEEKAEAKEAQKAKVVPVQEEIEIPQENAEPAEEKQEKIKTPEKIEEPEEMDKKAKKNLQNQNNEIKEAVGEPTEKVVDEMQIPKNTRLAEALDVKPVETKKTNNKGQNKSPDENIQRNEAIKKQGQQIQRKPPVTQEIQKQPEQKQKTEIKTRLAQVLGKTLFSNQQTQKQAQDKQPEKEITPQEVYNLQRLTERKHEGLLIAAENAQGAKIGENIKEQITDLAIKADDIYEKTGEELKTAKTNMQKYSILKELEAGLQKVENQIRARWPEVKFA